MAVFDKTRRLLLAAIGVSAASAAVTLASVTGSNLRQRAPLQAIAAARQWLNDAHLRDQDFAGKVVLVNFWTYSCINSLRTLPYLRDWAQKYQDQGLIVLGVHAPEFQFEHEISRVRGAVASLGLSYRVVLDNDFVIWRAFDNQAWPGFFVVDRTGHIAHSAFGEETYVEIERSIQTCLAEGGVAANDALSRPAGEGAQAAPDWNHLRSPETYVGYQQAQNFRSAGGLRRNAVALYSPAQQLALNQWTLAGDWNVGAEFAAPERSGSALRFRFQARDLHIVMGRDPDAPQVRFRITLDGAAPGGAHGVDADAGGMGVINEDRMYQMVRQPGAIGAREFEIEFLDPGARVYVFTFG